MNNDQLGAPDPDADGRVPDPVPPTAPDPTGLIGTDPDEAATFTRDYVSNLRTESAGHRTRATAAAARVDLLARALWVERVAATNLLADAADLDFDAESLDSPERIRGAIAALLEAKPHLRSRRVAGNVGQGAGDTGSAPSLVALLARGA